MIELEHFGSIIQNWNYRNEVGLNIYLDMKSEVEELLKACEPHREQFDMAVHSRELENIIAFSYLREYLKAIVHGPTFVGNMYADIVLHKC